MFGQTIVAVLYCLLAVTSASVNISLIDFEFLPFNMDTENRSIEAGLESLEQMEVRLVHSY